MWKLLTGCRALTSSTLLETFGNVSRSASCSFHMLLGTRTCSPLANQCSRQLLLEQAANSLLLPSCGPLLNQASGFKVKGRLKRRCKDCYFVVRQERLYVICRTHPRHKQMSMKKHESNTWILTDATQGPIRAW